VHQLNQYAYTNTSPVFYVDSFQSTKLKQNMYISIKKNTLVKHYTSYMYMTYTIQWQVGQKLNFQDGHLGVDMTLTLKNLNQIFYITENPSKYVLYIIT